MKDYGNAIKLLRKQNSMTQQTLAEKLNISGQAVSKWENNLAQPDFDTILKLTEIFEITLDEFTRLSISGEEVCVAGGAAATPANSALLIGVCAHCGLSIYDEDGVGTRSPKLLCKKCKTNIDNELAREKKAREEQERKEKETQKIKEACRHQENVKGFRRTLFTPLWIILPLLILFIIVAPKDAVIWIALYSLIYIMTVQIWWDNNWVADVFFGTFGKTFAKPGLIIPLSLDGFIWAFCVKVAMAIIWLLLSLVITGFGICLALILSPFTFGFALRTAITDVRNNKFIEEH